ncbi:restriction endonuclease subunit S [Streptomyces sp. MW-W600-10]|uniref:restriction endonuclease subunit S n=1 Tax=Streptomyces sp. MW-W600-10 TaxID=2829819 RepID=UPI002108CB99|nr:restriction endonuclease subunit S [Streptomyces sp. MW-W600-10]
MNDWQQISLSGLETPVRYGVAVPPQESRALMNEGYPLRPLGELMRLDIKRTPMNPATTYRLAGVLNAGKGVVAKGELDGGATEYAAMNVLRVDQVVMRKLTAWEGPITVVPAEFDGFVVSSEFPTFTLGPELTPEWMRHVCRSPQLWAEMKNRVSGTVQRRKRLNPDQLLQIELPLPPPEAQARIVDLLDSVDAQVGALDAEAGALQNVLRRFRADSMTDGSADEVRADEAFSITMGRQRSPQRATGPNMTPYLRSANVGYGTLNLSDVLEMDFNPSERETFGLRYGDVLVSEGSASETAVGMPAMWRDEIPAPVCFQNTLLRYRAIHGISIPAFVKHWCLWAYESGQFRDVAGGTNIKHIGSRRAVQMLVRLPNLAAQERLATELDSMSEAVVATRVEAARLRAARAGLLAGLLNRTIEI